MNILATFLVGAAAALAPGNHPAHPGPMTDWWVVSAAWAGAAGSFAAVVAALYIAIRGWRDAAAREARAQAQLVDCYTAWGPPLQGEGAGEDHRALFVVRNDSKQSVYRVEIPGTEIKIPLITADSYTSYAMTQAQAKKFGFDSSPRDRRYPVPFEFTDAAGLRWSRYESRLQSHGRARRGRLWRLAHPRAGK